MLAEINTNTCSKGEHHTKIKQTIPSRNNVCSSGKYETLKLDENLLFGHINLSNIPDKIGTSINIHSDRSVGGGQDGHCF